MRPRATPDLAQLSDSDLFTELAVGWEAVIKNVRRLLDGHRLLVEAGQYHAARVLLAVAQEESAKALILTDAARCPRNPPERFSEHLRRFGDHLAKGLYARACDMRPMHLGHLQEYLDQVRPEFYLDGPSGVDWIFRNEVIGEREDLLYVDYVARDDGEHHWTNPSERAAFIGAPAIGGSIHMVEALWQVGIGSPTGLRVVADLWRPAAITMQTRYLDLRDMQIQTVEALGKAGLLEKSPEEAIRVVAHEWPFPMFDLDLSLMKVDKNDLRDRQGSWRPEW